MSSKKAYKYFRGKEITAKVFGKGKIKGIVCGYKDRGDMLLIQITKGFGWKLKWCLKELKFSNIKIHLETIANGNGKLGYYWVNEFDIKNKV